MKEIKYNNGGRRDRVCRIQICLDSCPLNVSRLMLHERRRRRMPFKDLREFIARLEEEADWNLVLNSAHDL